MENNFEIFRQADKTASLAEAGENFNALLIDNKKRSILLMLSAGSALSILDYVGPNSLGENLTVSMLDERFSQAADVNNFLQFQKLDFYKDALTNGASFFGTLPRFDDTMDSLKQRWEKNLKTWRTENPNGIIIATLGMGPDGHTAGIFANDDEKEFDKLFIGDNWITAYDVGNKHQYKERITTTLTFFKNIDFGIGFVSGPEKKPKLDELIANQSPTNQFPASSWHEIKNVKIFTDIN